MIPLRVAVPSRNGTSVGQVFAHYWDIHCHQVRRCHAACCLAVRDKGSKVWRRSRLFRQYFEISLVALCIVARLLKALGKPPQNARKWFATVEIERMSADR